MKVVFTHVPKTKQKCIRQDIFIHLQGLPWWKRQKSTEDRQKDWLPWWYKKLYDDPIAHFKQVAQNMTDDIAPETISISESEKWDDSFNDQYIGYFPFTKILAEMAIYDFLKQKSRSR